MPLNEKSIDPVTIQALKKADEQGYYTIWSRYQKMLPLCGFGELGLCCTVCFMGPCRIDPFGEGAQVGICGADADTIASRNLARAIAGGTAAHSDHARNVIETLNSVAEGNSFYRITDERKFELLNREFGISGESQKEKVSQLAHRLKSDFGGDNGDFAFIKRAPLGQRERWLRSGVIPRAIDREVTEVMHRTTQGVDAEMESILRQAFRCALADGWGGSMMATEVQDVLFGSPQAIRSKVNLGVLKKDMVNIVVHGHEPVLSEMLVLASREQEMIKRAQEVGAKGINLCGICCTANELLMRQGYPIAGNFLQQELAVATGAVELLVVDVQCIQPSLTEIMGHYHTKIISTSEKAHIPGAESVVIEPANALQKAREVVMKSIENYHNRNLDLVDIPEGEMDLVAGFTAENVFRYLGGKYRASYRPLNDAIVSGRIRGVAAVVGCTTPKVKHDFNHLTLVKELIARDVLVVQTGCSAIACAKAGFLRPEAAEEYAGEGLTEICTAVGIPPVLHLGSCVDNSRILMACVHMVEEGGIGADFTELPVVACAPEAMSEKSAAIAFYVATSGIFTVFNPPMRVFGAKKLLEYLTNGIEKKFGGKLAFEGDPVKIAKMMVEHIDGKRKALGLQPMMYGKK
jgi:carbon-monoxide dehydrogenase catalytic subunit